MTLLHGHDARRWLRRGWMVVATLVAAVAVAASACAPPLPKIPFWYGNQGVKPSSVHFSIDPGVIAIHVRWVQYDQVQATAYATMGLNDCIPYCVNGTYHERPVRLHFFNVRDGRYTIGEVFYLYGTRNLVGETYERWDFRGTS